MVKVIAHRGAGIGPLENTLTGFQTAIGWGVDCIECDVRSSQDGVPVIIHDFALERVSNGNGLVVENSAKELQALEIGDGEKIPTLTEFFDLLAPHTDIGINLDVKVVDTEDQIWQQIQEYDFVHRTMISSFIQPVLTTFRSLNDELVTALLYEYDLQNPVEVAETLGCTAINPQLHFVDEQLVRTCHQAGLEINPWVINEPEEMRRFVDWGVEGIITDCSPRLLQILNRGGE
jgi:glycerophosphoryl diester phosphodiesterase